MSMAELFSREEAMGGLPARRASRQLAYIERKTARIVAQARGAIELFLAEEPKQEPLLDLVELYKLHRETVSQVTIADLERYASWWAGLLAKDPRVRATIIHLLAQKHNFAVENIPNIRAALGFDDDAVQANYERLYGQPLESIFEPHPTSVKQAGWTPRDGELNENLLRNLEAEFEPIHLPGGEVLFSKGDPGDSMYVLLNGRLQVAVEQPDNNQLIVGDVSRRQSVGEMALLAQENRSATAYAVRDSELFKLSRAGFERLIEKQPQAMVPIIRVIVDRLRKQIPGPPTVTSLPVAIVVISAGSNVPLSQFAEALALALESRGSVLHLNSKRIDNFMGEGAAQISESDPENIRIVTWLSEQEVHHRFILYEADVGPSAWSSRCIRQADQILIIGTAGADPTPGEVEKEVTQIYHHRATVRQQLVLLHPNRTQQPSGTQKWLNSRQVDKHYHVCLSEKADINRLVRFLTGQATGLVLGGGGAPGFAHIGVIRAIEELGLEIDLVGGTSIGSIIGGLFALGMDYQSLRREVIQLTNPKIFDYTVPMTSFLAGKKFNQALVRLFGHMNIEDTWREYFCTSSNLTQATGMIHQRGPLWKYVRASSSIPSIFSPIIDNGDLLADGMMMDNLPFNVMNRLCEGGPIIGVDVTPEQTLTDDYHFGPSLSGWQVLWQRLNPFATNLKVPSLLAITLRSVQLAGLHQQKIQSHIASLYLRPPVGHFNLLDISSFDEVIEIGYQTGRQELEAWLK